MKTSLSFKLTLAFVAVALSTAALIAAFIRVTSVDRLYRLVVDQQGAIMLDALEDYYRQVGSWENIDLVWPQLQEITAWLNIQTSEDLREMRMGMQTMHTRRVLFGLADARGRWIVPLSSDTPRGNQATGRQLRSGFPIVVDGTRVGTLLAASSLPVYSEAEANFLQRTNQALIWSVLGGLLLALVMGMILARAITRPLNALNRASQAIAAGDLQQKVPVESQDEIGQLAESFNRMSEEVARVNRLRQQMTADVAHDLRSPLTVIGGYIESMRDGVLPPTPERLGLIYAEIERLQRLVEDLRTLSLADAGSLPLDPQPASPKAILDRAAGLFQLRAQQQNLSLRVEADPDLPEVAVDETRIIQVMDNLLANALRYTPAGGEITLSARAEEGTVRFTVRDTGVGIPPEELGQIFERFHRADPSRHTEMGESGLGLAIVKAIVEAHGGQVWAESALNQGTSVHLRLPAAGAAHPEHTATQFPRL